MFGLDLLYTGMARSVCLVSIAEAQTAGEIDSTFDPMDLAEFLLASWEGAILRMKVEGGPAALDRFKKIVFQTIFSKPY
jgi:TetR/AcrR family transcriptional regulator, transcriptional repressor for nem operon